MCGRFVGFRKLEELQVYFPIDQTVCDVAANYNVAPSQPVLAIVKRDGQNVLDRFHWGLVPFWAKDTTIGHKLINARSETIAEKPSFRNAFRKKRCLILADGFYEWAGKKGDKQPVFITLPDDKPFAFAGLWETWQQKDSQERYQSCTIITTAACDAIRPIHHRMPVILNPDCYETWIDPVQQDTVALGNVLKSKAQTEFKIESVSKRVNIVRHNGPANIAPVQTEFDFNT
ncbi:MAG: SOS response-associated peptidase [Desulfobacteraceae bacterium]|nr:SOS response-associated peptidase [Desulfobacteraceae bacterium]